MYSGTFLRSNASSVTTNHNHSFVRPSISRAFTTRSRSEDVPGIVKNAFLNSELCPAFLPVARSKLENACLQTSRTPSSGSNYNVNKKKTLRSSNISSISNVPTFVLIYQTRSTTIVLIIPTHAQINASGQTPEQTNKKSPRSPYPTKCSSVGDITARNTYLAVSRKSASAADDE